MCVQHVAGALMSTGQQGSTIDQLQDHPVQTSGLGAAPSGMAVAMVSSMHCVPADSVARSDAQASCVHATTMLLCTRLRWLLRTCPGSKAGCPCPSPHWDKQHAGQSAPDRGGLPCRADAAAAQEIDPQLADLYQHVGQLLSRYKSGKLPKAFKIIPNLRNWQQVSWQFRGVQASGGISS